MKKNYSPHSDKFYQVGLRLVNSFWFWLAIIILLVASFNMCVYRFELVGGSVMQMQAKDVSTGCMIKAIMLQIAIGLFIITSIPKQHKKSNQSK
jgi:cytochrome c biogenesis protein ResB